MAFNILGASSLCKIRTKNDIKEDTAASELMLPGEEFSYQIVMTCDTPGIVKVDIDSELSDCIDLFAVHSVNMDFPAYPDNYDDNYITLEPGPMPDILIPLKDQNGYLSFCRGIAVLWVSVRLPHSAAAGEYSININLNCCDAQHKIEHGSLTHTKKIKVIACDMPQQKTIFTQWLHVDCIAQAHSVGIYSEKHWQLIENYIKTAVSLGINMILTPVFTPALDTAPNTRRACTQLVKIKKTPSGTYEFDFSLLGRWIDLCKKCGIKYYEISHLFSQWGCEFTPNILIEENGEEKYLFGWHVRSTAPEYKDFLTAFIPALLDFLKERGVADNCRFHISDEPSVEHLDNYTYAKNLVKPLLGDHIIMDALSNIKFYEDGLVENPVCATDHIEPFLVSKAKNLWAYYCCGEMKDVSNRFLAMPSGRNRIIGLQLYKYDIEGFLHWGYNFYLSWLSLYPINPYMTTSADATFPSGDAFSVYPYKDGAAKSLRAVIFKEALNDIEICRCLEKYIGKDGVVALIEKEAGMEITFSKYPADNEFPQNVMRRIKEELAKHL